MVICTFVSTECPKECPHSTNHKPIQDIYDFDKDGYPVTGYCHIVGGECGYRSLENTICTLKLGMSNRGRKERKLMYDERLLKDNEAEKPEQLPPVGSMPLLDIAILLPEYFSLRKKAKALKQKRADMHGKGSIENQRGCELHDDEWGECFESKLPEAEWCDYCRERQVVHREYHNTVRQAQSIWMKIYRRYGMGV